MEVEDLVFNVIEQNPERFDKLLQKLGYQKTTMCKENLTTKEMCEQLGINYSSWRKSDVRNHPEIVRLRDTTISRNHIYKSSSLSIIERVWKNRKNISLTYHFNHPYNISVCSYRKGVYS